MTYIRNYAPANQTEAHYDLCKRALVWATGKATRRGYRSDIDVRVADGYVADAVSLQRLQSRFWNKYVGPGMPSHDLVLIFEAKANRPDFLSTFVTDNGKHDNRMAPVGNLHWLVMQKGVAELAEVPEMWGVLEVSGNGLRELRFPVFEATDPEHQRYIGYQLLWKRPQGWFRKPGYMRAL